MEVEVYQEAWDAFLDAYKAMRNVNLKLLQLVCDMATFIDEVDIRDEKSDILLNRYNELIGVKDGESISNE